MYKLEVTLKQHTPLIHFQWHQEGATLRASEVKPKLDKYLISKIRDIEDKAFYNPESKSLKYKLTIIPAEETDNSIRLEITRDVKNDVTRYKTQLFPFFLSNMGGAANEEDLKNFILNNSLKLIFLTSYQELKNEIINNICDFFLTHNFGNRQSKGFGSFYPDEIHLNENWYKEPKSNFYFTLSFNNRDLNSFRSAFEKIELFYKALRGGINIVRNNNNYFYFKSLMFLYAKQKYHALWEKRIIKEKFFISFLNNQRKPNHMADILNFKSNDAFIFKDLLGLSTEESWLTYESNIEKQQAQKTHSTYRILNENKRDIERFPSPILFKPIITSCPNKYKMKIFIILKQKLIDDYFINKSFAIIKNNVKERCIYLDTPPEFSLKDFLEFCKNIDISNHVEPIYQTTREFRILQEIFEELHNN
ncbi:MAG: hypothetical protein ACP5O2_10595 [Bacteroidales bacterium]